jgi:hypothetical protein
MAASISILRDVRAKANGLKGYRAVVASLTFVTDAYASGGVAVTPANFGLTAIEGMAFSGDKGTVSYLWVYNSATGKIKAYNTAGDGDAFDEAGADTITGQSMRVIVFGY